MATAAGRFRSAVMGQHGAPEREREAADRVDEFDPRAAVQETARASFDTFREELAREIEALRGQNVAMGRLDSGFAWEDEGDVVRTGIDRLNREIAGRAVQTAGMEQQNRQFGAGLAADRAGRYFELLAADRDYETAEENARRARRNRLARGIGALVGGVGGFAAGGP